MSDDAARWQGWEAWAERALPVDAGKRALALEAIKKAIGDGLSPHAAAVAARVSAGSPPYASELRALAEDVQTIERLVAELGTVQPAGDLTDKALTQLKQMYTTKLERLRGLQQAAQLKPGGASVSAVGQVAATSGPSLREFFADNSILIISIAGAFLLIVATLLFEIYGTSALGGEGRFAAVLALNLIFGVAGYACLGRPSLRLVGQTYTAIFALMVPLTIAAAYVFLAVGSRGISRELAVGFGGLACSVLYAFLANRLVSKAYAVLSLLALAVGWTGLVLSSHAGIWTAPLLTPLLFAYIAVAYPPTAAQQPFALFTRYAEPFIHASGIFVIGWSFVKWISEWSYYGPPTRPSFQLAATLGLVTAGYCFYVWRSRHMSMLWAVWTGASLTLLAVTEPLGLGQRGYVVEFLILAWAYAIGARWMPGSGLRSFVRVGAAAQAALPALFSASPDGLQAAVLLAAAVIGVFLAIETSQPAWLLLATAIFSVDWFWLAKSLLPPPSRPTPDTLVLTYSPLPALFGVIGLGLALSRKRPWALPLYATGVVVAVAVAFGAVSQNDLTLAGRALLVYAGLAYVAAALETWWPGILVSLLAAAAAVLLLLGAAAAAPYWFPLAMTGVAVLVYGAHLAWRHPQLSRSHRYAALAIVGLTAASSFAVPDFWQRANSGPLAALVSLLATAGLTLVDGRTYKRPVLDYAAAIIASLGCIWIARYLGIDNVQADAALPGLVLITAGIVGQLDSRRPASLTLCRASIAVGSVVVIGVSAYQSVTENAASFYTILWVGEAVVMLLAGIGVRSRTLVVCGGAALALGALRALVIVLESVQVYIVFGVIAILLLLVAGLLAASRDRVSTARTAIRQSWQDWI